MLEGILLVAGLLLLLVALVGNLWFLCVAFRESVGWGLACIFVPFVWLLFLVLHHDKALKPFLVCLGGGLGAGCISVMLTAGLIAREPPRARASYKPEPAAVTPSQVASTPSQAASKPAVEKKAKKSRRVTSWRQVSSEID